MFWILRTGAPRRDLPPDYGHWNTTHRRFSRCQEDGHRARILSEVSDDPDLEWLMIDASHIKVYQHGTGAVGRQSGRRSDQMGLNTKPYLAVDALGMPVRTEEVGTVAGCTPLKRCLRAGCSRCGGWWLPPVSRRCVGGIGVHQGKGWLPPFAGDVV